MRNFTLTIVLILSWISVSVSEFHTVEVQPGEDITLLCSNYTNSPTLIFWFRVVKRLMPHCISSIYKPSNKHPASYCYGFDNGKFEVTSNMSTLFLKITQVDLSDSGLYFCGYLINKNPVIVGATYLEVQEVFDGIAKTMTVVLVSLTIFLAVVIIGLVVKIKKLQKAHFEEENPQQAESQSSDDLNYAAVTFHPKPKRNLRPPSDREVQPNANYSASR